MKKEYMGVLFVILSALSFSFAPIFAKTIYAEGLNVFTTVAFRFLFSAIAFSIIFLIKRKSVRISLKDIGRTFILGVLFMGIIFFYLYSLLYIKVALAVLIMFSYTIFVSI